MIDSTGLPTQSELVFMNMPKKTPDHADELEVGELCGSKFLCLNAKIGKAKRRLPSGSAMGVLETSMKLSEF